VKLVRGGKSRREGSVLLRTLEDLPDPEWDRLVTASPAGTFFHTRAWMAALSRTYAHFRPLLLLAENDDGEILGGIPAMTIRRLGASFLHSMPFGTYGGPLFTGANLAVAGLLLREWDRLARAPGVLWSQMSTLRLDPRLRRQFVEVFGDRARERTTHVIPIERGFDEIWYRRYDKENRTSARKAVRAGVVVQERSDAEGAEALHDLHARQASEWRGYSLHPRRFLGEILAAGRDSARIWVADYEGRPVAAVLVLYFRESVLPWISGLDADYRRLCASNLLYKVILEDAASRGFTEFNFGGSGDDQGVAAFKESFGAEPLDYPSWEWETSLFRLWKRARGKP
jgi:CelD/BcsL family acetyltransferase involved in cellulose biosynthesis